MSVELPPQHPTPEQGSVPKWKGVLFFAALATGILTLYYNGGISKEWLNRIGFIFNVFIGLLFAPAVLDVTGAYGAFVRWLEPRTYWLYCMASQPVPSLSDWLERLAGSKWSQVSSVIMCLMMVLVLIAGFTQVGFSFMVFPLFLFGSIGFIGVMYEVISRQIKEQPVRPFRLILLFLLFPIAMLVVVIVVPILFVLLHTLRIVSAISARFHGTLTTQEQLRSAVILWGIELFLIRNTLQFIATF